MNNYGLIGKSLKHSFSKEYFKNKFEKLNLENYHYDNYELDDISMLRNTINEFHIDGLNVTIPYKESVIELLDEVDSAISEIGAINTIVVGGKNKDYLKGYNTDVHGFKASIKPFLDTNHERALILGNGGAAKAVKFVLNSFGIPFLVATRTPKTENEIPWEDVNNYVMKYHQFIINTTPLGMYPAIDSFPNIPYEFVTTKHFLCDLVYNPKETVFLKNGKKKGAIVINGLSMLQHQAEKSWEIWNNECK